MSKFETKYRVIKNSSYNDFNSELPYTIVVVDYNPKTDLIRQRGFNNWGNHHCDLFSSRKQAESWFVSLINNEFIRPIKEENNKLKSQLALTETALELACRTMLVPDGYCEDIECPNVTCKDCLIEHFKIRAREELKSE